MARLCRNLPPGHWHQTVKTPDNNRCIQVDENGVQGPAEHPCPSFQQEMDAEFQSLSSLPKDRMWRTPIADGYAYYYVRSEKPLVLLHVPYGDRWQAHSAFIRGLNLKDIKQHVEAERRIEELFQKPQE